MFISSSKVPQSPILSSVKDVPQGLFIIICYDVFKTLGMYTQAWDFNPTDDTQMTLKQRIVRL